MGGGDGVGPTPPHSRRHDGGHTGAGTPVAAGKGGGGRASTAAGGKSTALLGCRATATVGAPGSVVPTDGAAAPATALGTGALPAAVDAC